MRRGAVHLHVDGAAEHALNRRGDGLDDAAHAHRAGDADLQPVHLRDRVDLADGLGDRAGGLRVA